MGNHDTGCFDFFQDIDDFELHLFPEFFVQSSHRFIEQKEFRLFDQDSGQSDPLTLTAG